MTPNSSLKYRKYTLGVHIFVQVRNTSETCLKKELTVSKVEKVLSFEWFKQRWDNHVEGTWLKGFIFRKLNKKKNWTSSVPQLAFKLHRRRCSGWSDSGGLELHLAFLFLPVAPLSNSEGIPGFHRTHFENCWSRCSHSFLPVQWFYGFKI